MAARPGLQISLKSDLTDEKEKHGHLKIQRAGVTKTLIFYLRPGGTSF